MAEKSRLQDKLLPVLVVMLIGAAFGLGVMWGKLRVYEKDGGMVKQTTEPTAQAPEEIVQLTEEQWQAILAEPAFAMGDESAPVTIVEFTDYECPFCKRYVDETMGQIEEKYVDTGKVKYLIHDLPLPFHAGAKPAALAARCAGEQGAYQDMHALLFENQEAWTAGEMETVFKKYATQLGLNAGQFTNCLANGQYDGAIDKDLTLAASVGASGTPTFFINGTMLVGAQPMTAFETAIEASLK
jgi:protein-disulfide isomerase